MLRFSANLSFLFLDRPFLERFEAAAACGFKGVEFHFPYAFPADELRDAARRAGVEVVLFNFPPGDWAAGERGIATLGNVDRMAAELEVYQTDIRRVAVGQQVVMTSESAMMNR